MWKFILAAALLVGCGAPTAETIGETEQAATAHSLYRMVEDNLAGTTSSMTPINCPPFSGDPGHWNCVSGLLNPSDVPPPANKSATFTPELCINQATGGFETFVLAEATYHASTITRLIPEGTIWVWGMSPGQSDSMTICLTRHGASRCEPWPVVYANQQAGIYPLIFTSTVGLGATDPSTLQAWSPDVAFGDVAVEDDVTMTFFVNHPISYNLCIGAAWLEVQYSTNP